MSTPSSSRRPSKTADFTEFFRSSHTSARQAQSDTENYFSSSTLDVPGESSSTKKKTKIPFLGRTRKKSTHSTASSHGVPSASRSDRESADVSTRTPSTDHHPTAHGEEPPAASRLPHLTAKPSPVKSTTSLGSKLAAHFTPSKSRKPPPLSPARSSPPPSIHTGGTLSPPYASQRATSFDSISGANQNRSITPKPAQPSITVSFSPDSVEEYKDLFTLPKNKTPTNSSSIPQALSRSPSTRRPEGDSDATPRSTPPPVQPFRSAESHDSRASRSQSEEKQLTPSLSRLRQPVNNSSVSKRADHSPLDRSKSMVHRKEVGIPGIIRPSATPAQLYATATRTPLPAAELQAATVKRTRTVSAVAERRSGPPTMPLPLPPAPDTPPPSPPVSIPPSPQIVSQMPSAATSPKPLLRPRANTISSVSNSPRNSNSTPPPTSETTSRSKLQSFIKSVPKDFDIDYATPQQLKAALVTRNQQYDELATYLLKVTETHVAEVAALEKKIYALEKEAARKDKEIKGLTWLVNNNQRGPPVSSSGVSASRIQSGLESDQDSASAGSPSAASSRPRGFRYTDDSGAESHATSGAESLTSGAESTSVRGKRIKRPFTLGESSYNLYKATMGKRATETSKSSSEYATPSKRASAASLSASSSSSSLMPSTPNSTTASSLSAIPETYGSTVQSRGESSDAGDRSSRASNRVSTSSTISSASSSYAANLKRNRPPSIAQVLEKSEKLTVMDEVLEQLRPPGIA